MSTALFTDARMKQHDPGPGHPEQVARYDAVMNALKSSGVLAKMKSHSGHKATWDDAALIHTRDYLKIVEQDFAAGRHALSTGDTDIMPASLDAAFLAVGCVQAAVDEVVARRSTSAFCVVRPPGHHAGPARGMGFCIFNNIAIGARHAQRKHGLERILIADWDVHHGNGTQDAFYDDGSVLFLSTHQSPWYPGTGAANETGVGKGKGLTMNFPFPAGAAREEILPVFANKLKAAADAFKPDLVMISAGFDSRTGDPLGQFRLTDADFAELTNVMAEIAHKHAHDRLVSVLEGGYNLAGLGTAATAHVRALINAGSGAAAPNATN
jgi:acetoin utilization deacetylase AcuC-like enzyme